MQNSEDQLKSKMRELFDLDIYPLKLKEILAVEGKKAISLIVSEPEEYSDYEREGDGDDYLVEDRILKIVRRCEAGYSLLDDEIRKLKSEFGGRGYSFSVSAGLFGNGVRYFVQKP